MNEVTSNQSAQSPVISLLPLDESHYDALQQVYHATPGYWQMYNLPGAPAERAAADLSEAASIPGRTLLGIVRHLAPDEIEPAEASSERAESDAQAAVELVGLIDFRLQWPDPDLVYLGIIMVAEPYQRQGIGSAAWHLLQPWLATEAKMKRVRTGIEQFNHIALRFFQSLGFELTGDSNRIQSGSRWVRQLYMEQSLLALTGPPAESNKIDE